MARSHLAGGAADNASPALPGAKSDKEQIAGALRKFKSTVASWPKPDKIH